MSYIDTIDIERHIEQEFVLGLRAIFENDSSFVYNEDDTKTGIMITPDYPAYNDERTVPLSMPYLVITDINYQFSRDTAFGNNFSETAYDETGFAIGETKYASIPYSLTILCYAKDFDARDLANKVIGYIMHTWEGLFDAMHLNIRNASKGPARLQTQYPDKVYQVPIMISGVASWTGVTTFEDSSKLTNILNRIAQFDITMEEPTIQ